MILILLAKSTFPLLELEVALEIIGVNSVWDIGFETLMSQPSTDVKLLLSYRKLWTSEKKRNNIRLYGCHKTVRQHGNWERKQGQVYPQRFEMTSEPFANRILSTFLRALFMLRFGKCTLFWLGHSF